MKNLTNFRVNDIVCCGKNSATEFSAIIVTLRYHRADETIIVLPQQYCIIDGEYDSLANLELNAHVREFIYGLGEYVFAVGEDDVPALNFIEEYRKEHDLSSAFWHNSRILRDMGISI